MGRPARRSKYIEVPSSPENVNSVAIARAGSSSANLAPSARPTATRFREHAAAKLLHIRCRNTACRCWVSAVTGLATALNQHLAPQQRDEVVAELYTQRRAVNSVAKARPVASSATATS